MKELFAIASVVIFLSSCIKEPEASFTIDKTEIYEGDEVTFTNTSIDDETNIWRFSDGIISDKNVYTRTFNLADTYEVTLNAYSRNEKKSSAHSAAIEVKPALVKVYDGKDTTFFTKNIAGIDHMAVKNLVNCGSGINTGSYHTSLMKIAGQTFTIRKGILSWTCASSPSDADFKSFFSPATVPYSPDSLSGVEVEYNDGNDGYSTTRSYSQDGSSFVITSLTDEIIFGRYYVRISGTFKCTVRNDITGNSLQISGSFDGLPFENE